jgi:16S rRNA (cytosine967-C5)-methyltransferase
VGRLKENLARLSAGEVRLATADAARPEAVRAACEAAGLPPAFHAILLDVPCTNTGVLRRRPDARWRFSREYLQKAASKQRSILDAAAGLLEAGGRIVYSTCSLEPEENEGQVGSWLASHPDFTLADSAALFPPDTGTDGAYAALLVRK